VIKRYVKIYKKLPPDFVLTEHREDWHQYTTREGLEKMIAEDKYNSTYRWIDSGTLECTTYDANGNVSAIFEYHTMVWSEHQFRPKNDNY
jgi:hypothetical protein